jgi:DNA-directed RNA polymerase subunit beta'
MTLKIVPRNFQIEYIEEFKVTNPNPAEPNTNKFNEDGVFSERIFGRLANGTDFSCLCGKYEGEFNLGFLCKECNTKVSFKGLNLAREGWVDLHFSCIHPLFYRYIRKIMGKTVLEKMLHYKGKIDLYGHTIEPEFTYPYEGIGMLKFEEEFDHILKEFLQKKKQKVVNDYEFIMKYREYIFIDKFPIINSKLRPATLINNDLDYHEINNYYNGLIKNSETIESLTDIEATDFNILALMYKNQELVNLVSDSIISELSNKEGYIRNSLFGSRLNFTARCVITPLPGGYQMNDIVIPYIVALELLKPIVIRRIQKLKKITLFKANKVWFEGTLKFDKFIHKVMIEIINTENIRLLLNRNPTIAVGSILLMKIKDIKTDYDDLTSSINNLILNNIGGDYDGDVLNHVMIFGKEFIELFEPFTPSQTIIDVGTGRMSNNFVPTKDVALGMNTLLN